MSPEKSNETARKFFEDMDECGRSELLALLNRQNALAGMAEICAGAIGFKRPDGIEITAVDVLRAFNDQSPKR